MIASSVYNKNVHPKMQNRVHIIKTCIRKRTIEHILLERVSENAKSSAYYCDVYPKLNK